MPYYLAPYIGTGNNLDAYRPRGSDQPGWSAIDLRPDGGATLGGGGLNACLLHLPVANPDPQLRQVALDPTETVGPATIAAINTRLGVTLGQTRWQRIVEELLTLPPANGWKPLLPTFDGWMQIYLGGLFSRWRHGSVGAAASDAFTGTDGTLLPTYDANWSTAANFVDLSIQSNGAGSKNLNEFEGDLYSGIAWSNNHYSQATLSAVASLIQFVFVRGITVTRNLYASGKDTNDWANANYHIWKYVSGTPTDLLDTAVAIGTADVVYLDASGTSITLKQNGSQIGNVTDSAIASGSPGISAYHDTASVKLFDDWSAADLAAGPPLRTLLGVGT